jgi:hypothetical protein
MATSQKSISACVIALDEMNAQLLDVAPAPNMEIWEGALPNFPEDADPGTLLATLPMSATPFGAAYPDGNRATCDAAPITSDPDVAVTGTAQYWRIRTNLASGNVIYQGDISTTAAATGSLQFVNTSFEAGGLVAIDTFKLHLNE